MKKSLMIAAVLCGSLLYSVTGTQAQEIACVEVAACEDSPAVCGCGCDEEGCNCGGCSDDNKIPSKQELSYAAGAVAGYFLGEGGVPADSLVADEVLRGMREQLTNPKSEDQIERIARKIERYQELVGKPHREAEAARFIEQAKAGNPGIRESEELEGMYYLISNSGDRSQMPERSNDVYIRYTIRDTLGNTIVYDDGTEEHYLGGMADAIIYGTELIGTGGNITLWVPVSITGGYEPQRYGLTSGTACNVIIDIELVSVSDDGDDYDGDDYSGDDYVSNIPSRESMSAKKAAAYDAKLYKKYKQAEARYEDAERAYHRAMRDYENF